jgi:formylglycine-generating enzyme required for sulfatase activity
MPPRRDFLSCASISATCGGNKDCCASNLVTGGSFARKNDPSLPATVSSFRLDVYEVTVARFRAFVKAGQGTQAMSPLLGEGAHPKIENSGWHADYTEGLTVDSAALRAAVAPGPQGGKAHCTWTENKGDNESRPMNCITWFEAFAFCAWDGGRLPTWTEANYAAAGGSEQRDFPWGGAIDSSRAIYDCTADGSAARECSFDDLLPVGSRSPQGDGRWGQADLSGNVAEWVLDYAALPYSMPCNDCSKTIPDEQRIFRGGAYDHPAEFLQSGTDAKQPPTSRYDGIGVRCARSAL